MRKLIYYILTLLILSMNFTICRAVELDSPKEKTETDSLQQDLILAPEFELSDIQEMVVIGGDDEVEFIDYYQLGDQQAREDYFNLLPGLTGFFSAALAVLPLVPITAYIIIVAFKVNVPYEYSSGMTDENIEEFNKAYRKRIRKRRSSGFLTGLGLGLVVVFSLTLAIMQGLGD